MRRLDKSSRRRQPMGVVAGQAALHRPDGGTLRAPSWPRPSSTRSPPRSCTARISTTTSSCLAGREVPSTSKAKTRRAPSYRAYYPAGEACARRQRQVIGTLNWQRPFGGPERATWTAWCARARAAAADRRFKLRANFQIQVLSSLFFRNRGAGGEQINGFRPGCRSRRSAITNEAGQLFIDAAAVRRGTILPRCSVCARLPWSRTEVPSAYGAAPAGRATQAAGRLYISLGLAQAGQDNCLSRVLASASNSATSSHRAHGKRAW